MVKAPVTQKSPSKSSRGKVTILLSSTKPIVTSWKVVVHLPAQGGPDHQGNIRQPENQHPQGQDHIPAEHYHRQPGGNLVIDAQSDETGRHQDFVRQGVKVTPQEGLLLPGSGDEAVRQIAHPGQDKHQQGLAIVPLDQKDDEQGSQDDPKQGDEVGNS